jgi:hypothetical protein
LEKAILGTDYQLNILFTCCAHPKTPLIISGLQGALSEGESFVFITDICFNERTK